MCLRNLRPRHPLQNDLRLPRQARRAPVLIVEARVGDHAGEFGGLFRAELGGAGAVVVAGGGFGAEVRDAMRQRAEHLVGEGLAEQQGRRVIFNRNLIETLRRRELDAMASRLAKETGQPFKPAESGEYVAGTYRQRLTLASGRFAMIDDGLGFQLVPWSPSLEKQIGRHVSGVARDDGGVDWDFGRKRGIGL